MIWSGNSSETNPIHNDVQQSSGGSDFSSEAGDVIGTRSGLPFTDERELLRTDPPPAVLPFSITRERNADFARISFRHPSCHQRGPSCADDPQRIGRPAVSSGRIP